MIDTKPFQTSDYVYDNVTNNKAHDMTANGEPFSNFMSNNSDSGETTGRPQLWCPTIPMSKRQQQDFLKLPRT